MNTGSVAIRRGVMPGPRWSEGILADIKNGRRIGATLVNGDLLRPIVQADCPFQKAPCCGLISPGSEQEIHCVTAFVHRSIEVLPLVLLQ